MKTKSLSIFLVALFVVEMNLGTEENNNENKKGEKFEYKIMKEYDIPEFGCILKMILIGNSNVGKSALIEKIRNDKISETYNETIGFEFLTLDFNIVSDIKKPVLRYQIWDCGGDKNYRDLVKNFFQSARVCLLAYNVTNEKSFKDIDGWVNEVKSKNTDKTIHFVLIGNKIDLKRVVPKEKGENFAKEKGMKFVEVSAKTGAGIKDLEDILAKIIYEEFKEKNKKKDESDENCCEKICCNCCKDCFKKN